MTVEVAVFGVRELQFIGSLKSTTTAVRTDTSSAPSIGLVDTTTGRGWFEDAAVAALAAHMNITNAATEILLTMHPRSILRFAEFLFNAISPDEEPRPA